ncbi:MAG: hypothetical protein Q9195_004434 [Heterodermia aff. obscurata]
MAGSPPNPPPPTEELKGGFSHASPPISPSAAYRRPVRPNNGYQSFGEYLGSSPGKGRPLSMHSQRSIYPPPPHQPQAHFYGAPEIDFGTARSRSESMPRTDNFCCMFDTLASAGDGGQRATEDVLLIGFANGLSVHSVGKSRANCIGRLEGLRGPVLKAKILPSHARYDTLQHCRPLVAVVIHGVFQPPVTQDESRPESGHSGESSFSVSGSMLQALQAAGDENLDLEPFYQTTVEVFSLRENKHVSTLLRGPKTRLEASQIHPYIQAKPPPTSLQVQASERFIVIASGASGEVFVFNNEFGQTRESQAAFKCIGKFWTRTSQKRTRSLSVSSNTSEADNDKPHRPDVALFSLNHKLLAIVPPVSSTQSTLHMSAEKNRSAQRIPGLSSHTAPTEPSVNCDTDIPETEGLFNRVARDFTQEFIKGARWVGGQGKQAWSNYWSKPALQHAAPSPGTFHPLAPPAFPPTHANDGVPTTKSGQPTTVSIIALEKLCDGQHGRPDKALQPTATFALPAGCSWVSFAPSGLHLLTVSLKGDVQQIWSLMRMVHGEAAHGNTYETDGRAPFVREIKRFTRLTEARIVDVVWKDPRGDSLAILTERGTVHINSIPAAALQWPPPRRVLRAATALGQPNADDKDTDVAVPAASIGSAFGAAFNMVSESAQPLMTAVRGRPASVGSAFSNWTNLGFPVGAGAKSGKVVAAGFNRSVSAATSTVNSLQHMGENRLALPGKPGVIMPGCVRWLGGKNQGLIAVTGGNIIRTHSVAQSTTAKAGKRRLSVIASKASEFQVPSSQSASGKSISGQAEGHHAPASHEGFWDSLAPSRQPRRKIADTHSLSHAEIETNAPYQPFHTDRRVGFYVYDDDMISSTHRNAPWAFGEAIRTTKISAGSSDGEEAEGLQQPSHLENLIQSQGDQLVVTTRRRRTQAKLGDHESEFFEDDCEVIDFADERV